MVALFLVLAGAGSGTWSYLTGGGKADPGILEASGRIEGDEAVVGAKVGGRIVKLPIREGQALAAGQLIAQSL